MDEEEKYWEVFLKSEGFFQLAQKSFENGAYVDALKNFEKAAELNHSAAMEQLAYMYTYGIGVDLDIEKAVDYLEKFIDIARDDGVDFSFGKCIKAGVQAAYFGSKYALDKVAEIYLESLLAEENKDSDSDTWNNYNFFSESSALLAKGNSLDKFANTIYCYKDQYKLSAYQAYFSLYVTPAAKLGNAMAMAELAAMYRQGLVYDAKKDVGNREKLYRDGLGIHKDKNKSDRWYAIALKCFEKVADFLIKNKSQSDEMLNIVRCGLFNLAEINLLGDISEQDGYKAIELFNKVVELGNSDKLSTSALKKIAEIYRDGRGGVIPAGKKAVNFFTKAYENGDNSVLKEIAKIYNEGLGGIIPDKNKAVEILTKIYENNEWLAWHELAKVDGKKAIELLNVAYENGDDSALIKMAEIYKQGLGGVVPDGNKAIELLTKAYKKGTDSALNEIAEIYRKGIGGVTPNGKRAIEFFTRYCENTNMPPYVTVMTAEDIANVYRLGEGNVEKNIGLAIEWLEKAGCFVEIAEMYRDGVDVRQSGEKAIHYFTKAVEGGSTAAMKEIAKIYKNAIGGVEKNISLATEWFEKSCNLIELAEMYKNGVEVKRNATKAIHYFTKAAELGDTYAMKQLSEIYRQGLDEIEKDLEKSKIWILRMNDLEPYGIF